MFLLKQTLPDKTILYYFKEKEVDQITLTNGINVKIIKFRYIDLKIIR